MSDKKIRPALLGFSRKSVKEYIDELESQTAQKSAELEAQISALSERCNALFDENERLREKANAVENEKKFIADAIVEARARAQTILDEAQKLADKKRDKLEREHAARVCALEKERQEHEKRLDAARTAARSYADTISIAMETLKDELREIIK